MPVASLATSLRPRLEAILSVAYMSRYFSIGVQCYCSLVPRPRLFLEVGLANFLGCAESAYHMVFHSNMQKVAL